MRQVVRLPQSSMLTRVKAPMKPIETERRRSKKGETVWLVGHWSPPRGARWQRMVKRLIDVIGAVVGLVVLAPFLLCVGMTVKLGSRGPVLFRQVRIGRGGRSFRMLKIRSMVANAEDLRGGLENDADAPLFKVWDDPRVTPIGRFLRSTSVDELPQLWNVLVGEMSLVGPRPALPAEVSGWTSDVHRRLQVKPGITGMWQVHGRSAATFDDYVRFDLYYVDNWSLSLDLRLLVGTVVPVLGGRGAC